MAMSAVGKDKREYPIRLDEKAGKRYFKDPDTGKEEDEATFRAKHGDYSTKSSAAQGDRSYRAPDQSTVTPKDAPLESATKEAPSLAEMAARNKKKKQLSTEGQLKALSQD